MKSLYSFSLILMFFLVVSCSNTNQDGAIRSWAFDFVTWNYEVYSMTNDEISNADIENEIGKTTSYSTNEKSDLPNLYSNRYKVGTKLFKIKGSETDEFIAVLTDDGTLYKAKRMDGMKVK